MSDSVDMVAAMPDAELVDYMPFGEVEKQFMAIVDRKPTQVESAGGFQYGANTIVLTFPLDAVNGVLTVQVRKDRMRVKKNIADAQKTDFSVNVILKEDAASHGGMFTVLAQA